MLVISYNKDEKNNVESIQHLEIHIKTCSKFPWSLIQHVVEVQADGDELEWIKQNIGNIPTSKNRVIRWYGDHAKFIASNWKG